LAVGDEAFRKKCTEKLKELTQRGVTMLDVSHSMGMVKDLCPRGIVIHEHKVLFDGPIDRAVEMICTTPHSPADAEHAPAPRRGMFCVRATGRAVASSGACGRPVRRSRCARCRAAGG